MPDDIKRDLGRLEGKLDQLITTLNRIDDDLADHKAIDREGFAVVSARFGLVQRMLDERTVFFTEQAKKLDEIGEIVSRAKGAWWMMVVVVAIIASVGAAFTWLLSIFPHTKGG